MAKKAKKRPSILACTEDGSPVVEIFSMQADGDKLIMDCKALGSMRMNVVIKTSDVAKGWPVVKESRSAIIKFARQIPKAIRQWKKAGQDEGDL
jgi:hypothetical protein